MTGGRIVSYPPADYAIHAAGILSAVITKAVDARGRCSVALAGGTTPVPVYRELARPPLSERIPWGKVHVFFGDERAVPPDDPWSNFGAAQEALLSHVPIPAGQVHPIDANRADVERAAADYERLLPDALDLLILGMGLDGHTASLFPGSPALDERERRVVTVRAPQPPAVRLTITPPVIAAARTVVVLVTGGEKGRIAAQALHGGARLPIALARHATWVLDAAAAASLTSA